MGPWLSLPFYRDYAASSQDTTLMITAPLLCAIGLCLCASDPPGPNDAFLSNYASLKVQVDYTFTPYEGSVESLDRLRSWKPGEIGYLKAEDGLLSIRWACGDATEYLACESDISGPKNDSSSGEAYQKASAASGTPTRSVTTVPRTQIAFEALYNGEVQAEHRLRAWDIQVHVPAEPAMFLSGRGPFCWWGTFRFADCITPWFPKARRVDHPLEVHGYKVICSVYQEEFEPGMWARLEIWYDPSINYVPRYVRHLAVADGRVQCREIFVRETYTSQEGGFVPTDLFETDFVGTPPALVASSQLITDSIHPTGRIVMGRLKAIRAGRLDGEVGLERLEGSKRIVAIGGSVPLPISNSKRLTIKTMEHLLGRNLRNPMPASLLTLDQAELDELGTLPRGGWSPLWLAFLVLPLIVVAGLVVRRGKAGVRAIILILTLCLLGVPAGCVKRPPSPADLAVTLEGSPVLYDPLKGTVSLTMNAYNRGSVPIKIITVDGGCACRKVDQSQFPVVHSPGATLRIPVTVTTPSDVSDVTYKFQFQTDAGLWETVASVLMLPTQTVSPRTLASPVLVESEDWEFDLTYRRIFQSTSTADAAELVYPKQFNGTRVGTNSGAVARAPGYMFEDTTYRVKLLNRDEGTFKEVFRVKRADDKGDLEVPAVWNRVSFLSPSPAKAYLGTRTARIFLRCPDETVELTRVASTPKGVRAVVSSPREVSISLKEDAPFVLDDILTVETTLKSHPPLKIPVIRFTLSQSDRKLLPDERVKDIQ
jgi:hypothetical protein